MIHIVCRWIAWPLLAAVGVATLSHIAWRPVTVAPADFERFVAFAVLGGVFCLAYPKHRIRVFLLLVVSVGLLEALQHLVTTRHGRIHDTAIKALGAAIGMLLAGQLATWCSWLRR